MLILDTDRRSSLSNMLTFWGVRLDGGRSKLRAGCTWLWLVLLIAASEAVNTTSSTVNVNPIYTPDPVMTRQKMTELMFLLENTSSPASPLQVMSPGVLGVPVNISLNVESIMSVDNVRQTMTSGISVFVVWVDPQLSWTNMTEYDDIVSVELRADAVWTPNVYFSNAVSKESLVNKAPKVNVHIQGLAYVFLDLVVETTCSLNLKDFPFDTQECPLSFAQIDPLVSLSLKAMEWAGTRSSKTSEWKIKSKELKDAKMSKGGTFETGAPILLVTIERQTLFYGVCLVLPMVTTSFLNTLVFLLPVGSGEKISFLVTIFVSTSVFIGFFKDMMPRGLRSTPRSLQLLIGVMGQSLLVMLATVLVMNRNDGRNESTNNRVNHGTVSEAGNSESVHDAEVEARPFSPKSSRGRQVNFLGFNNSVSQQTTLPRSSDAALDGNGIERDGPLNPWAERPLGVKRGNSLKAFSLSLPLSVRQLDYFFFALFSLANIIFMCTLFIGM